MKQNANSQTSELQLTRREAVQGIATLAASSLLASDAFSQTRASTSAADSGGEQPFSQGWRFHRGEAAGADAASFDDSEWRTLDVPHDWSIEDLPDAATQNHDSLWAEGTNPVRTGPFDLYASEGQGATGWTVGGIGWYRKTFQRPQVAASGKAEVRFDGVYMNADVWINGTKLGNHPYGYTGFAFDLTPHLKEGANTLAVRVDTHRTQQPLVLRLRHLPQGVAQRGGRGAHSAARRLCHHARRVEDRRDCQSRNHSRERDRGREVGHRQGSPGGCAGRCCGRGADHGKARCQWPHTRCLDSPP